MRISFLGFPQSPKAKNKNILQGGFTVKVKIGDKIYDSENEPIMIITTEEEMEQIYNMKKSYFDLLISKGFTQKQALEIIKEHVIKLMQK
jgi:rRNA processing protein Krr1/Pno1